MGLLTFKGGIHPFEGKEMSMDKQVVELWPTGEMVYPLSQHIGAPAKPLVKKGDRVLRGQKIAEAGGFISAHIHSSCSGTVKAIETRRTSGGNMVMSIVVDNDGQFETVDFSQNLKPLDTLYTDDVREMIKEAGIVGMGGAGFPTNVKYSPKNENDIDHIIVNGAECEPYLTSDYRRMVEEPDKLIAGLTIAVNLFPKAKGIIAIEDNKPEAIRILREKIGKSDKLSVNVMKTKYPQGGERSIIYANTGRTLNSSMLPADVGCIVSNVDTIIAIYEAVCEGKPLMERIVTVTGDAIANPINLKVPIGTNCNELIKAAGGFLGDIPPKIIAGGPMMGRNMVSLDVPTVKGLSAILCLSEDVVSASETTNCIRCGKCVEVCPSRLMPAELATIGEHHDTDKFKKLDGMECVECGCCSYVCPAKRHLAQTIASTRKQILAMGKK
ncbi:MAG: electron transport complex subunit RsxC [Lachnospiraceae bacterium]|nr:electron transport complex subunit RsxC [Lachnospiraceae bacterium]